MCGWRRLWWLGSAVVGMALLVRGTAVVVVRVVGVVARGFECRLVGVLMKVVVVGDPRL